MRDYVKERTSNLYKEMLIDLLNPSLDFIDYIRNKNITLKEGYSFKIHFLLDFPEYVLPDSKEHTEALKMIEYLNSFKNCKAQLELGMKYCLTLENENYIVSNFQQGWAGIEIMVW